MAFGCSDSDSSYDDDGPPLRPNTTSRGGMRLRNASHLKCPARYREDTVPVDPGRPAFVHPDPVFDMDRAHFVQWRTLALDEPSPGEALHKLWQEQGEPRDAFGKPVVPSSPSQGDPQTGSPPGPTVAHLQRRQSAAVRPDRLQPVANTVEQRDAFDEAFENNLADFDDDDEPQSNGGNMSRVFPAQLSPHFKDWSALSENVQWAIIYDLANDHQDGVTAAANMLCLTMTEVINFVNLYLREKALWENGASQAPNAHPADALPQFDVEQDEVVQPVPEAEMDQPMGDLDPDHQHFRLGADQMAIDTEVGPQPFDLVYDIWNEPEVELFLEADNNVAAEERVEQISTEKVVDQSVVQADGQHAVLEGTPPPVELVTDSFSREDVTSGRGYLTFMGLQKYADRFSEWFGTGTSFREIPGIFDENNELIFPTEDTQEALYRGNELDWEGPAPQPLEDHSQREWPMEALPLHPPPPEQPLHLELRQFQILAKRINSRPITRVPTNTFARMLADDDFSEGEAENLVRSEPGAGVDNNAALRRNKSDETYGNLVPGGRPSGFGLEGVRLFNPSSAMPNAPSMPRLDSGIAHRFPGHDPVGSDVGDNMRKSIPSSHSLPSHQLPHLLQPHYGRAVDALSFPGHESSQVTGTDGATQARSQDATIVATNPTRSPSAKTSSNQVARGTAENDRRDAQVTAGPASGEAVTNAAQAEVQEADSDRFSQNGIGVKGFPKCSSCFAGRARCDGGRPCGMCSTRNRRCKDVTKADLDKYPDRAERVITDKAKADAKAAQDEGEAVTRGPASTPKTAVATPAVSTALIVGAKRKHSAIAGDAPSGRDDSDLDQFPPEKDDPKDSDYDTTPKKKRPKKGNTPASKKQATTQGASRTCTPNKRGPRGPYKKKAGNPTPRTDEPVAGATSTPTPQPGGRALAGSAIETSTRKKSAKAPAGVKNKSSDLSQSAGEGGPLKAGAGISVHDAAKTVRHAGGGMTNVMPGETHSARAPSFFSPNRSVAVDARYLGIPFAPVNSQTHSPRAPVSRPSASPSQGAYAMPGIYALPGTYTLPGTYALPGVPRHVMLPRHQTMPAGNSHLSVADLPSTASDLNTRMAVHEKLPVAFEGMSLVPQFALPSTSGSPGATETSPASQSSGSETTVSMDFLSMPPSMPLIPAQGSPAYSHYSHGSMPGRIPQNNPAFSPGSSAGMVSLGSPTAPRRRLSVSSHNNGAHGPVTSVPSPLMAAAPGLAVAPGVVSPYAMYSEQRPIPRPISRLQVDYGYPVPQQSVPQFSPPGAVRGYQGEEMRTGLRGVSASPSQTASPRPKREAGASPSLSQQPARKRPKTSDSPLAPPREAESWKDLARTQWANESQENQPGTPKPSVKPMFGGDGPYEVSFSQFTRIQEPIDPALEEMAKARKTKPSSAGPSENH